MINNEIKTKYAKTWKLFIRLVRDFNEDTWLYTGRMNYVPARLSLHILQSAAYYIQASSLKPLSSGIPFTKDCWGLAETELPARDVILDYIEGIKGETDAWLDRTDLGGENNSFEWTGNTNLAVILFSFQHSMFHLGELCSLLNESKNGGVEDHYIYA